MLMSSCAYKVLCAQFCFSLQRFVFRPLAIEDGPKALELHALLAELEPVSFIAFSALTMSISKSSSVVNTFNIILLRRDIVELWYYFGKQIITL